MFRQLVFVLSSPCKAIRYLYMISSVIQYSYTCTSQYFHHIMSTMKHMKHMNYVIFHTIHNSNKKFTEPNALMDDSSQRAFEIGFPILLTSLWILVILTVTGILKWECCIDCITRLRQRIPYNRTDTTGSHRVQFVQRNGQPDDAMVRMIFETAPPSQNLSTVTHL